MASLRTALSSSPRPLAIDEDDIDSIVALITSVRRAAGNQVDIGPTCLTPALADWLGISRQGISKGVRERRILGVQIGRTWHYPMWQLGANQIAPAATQVFKSLLPPDPSPAQRASLAAWAWRQSEDDSPLRGASPATWIREGGETASVLDYARHTWHCR
ncbi:hypothetical protein H8R18_02790 [Nanchangia anserum]|uniref:Uncharacterized protein n=1 Tax=Nanchangia anserum TaxID=2692125 RepID=A0A8I0KWD9_9ACTO|nr:hypothetical protein [Nanchangia anserum]MBD3689904.1 hypothetical protein [Nanchangia anserum]QOX82279.1 hypothetical protein H8R18_02790 [Nanchangia anserum]